MTRPESSGERKIVERFWKFEAFRFLRGSFGLALLVMYALKYGYISEDIRSRSGIDMIALREGLARSLGNLKLFVTSFAVDVPQLLGFLATPPGERFAASILERKWRRIVSQAKMKLDYGLVMSVSKIHSSSAE
jgi:hypothetical protein